MTTRIQPFVTGEFYHLYSRGVEKRKIFNNSYDYKHFLYLMYICNTERTVTLRDVGKDFDRGEIVVSLGAYCLMPNHFHILVREKTESGISNYMLKLLTAYSMYFNKKYKRTGRLFESTFKSEYVSNDNYLKYLYSYIHLNPVKLVDKNWRENINRRSSELLDFSCTYPYSSMHNYLQGDYKLLEPQAFPPYFTKPSEYKKELADWLTP